ncbi:alcohol dehydrogenase catalytic domain-containing protein [Streptomyces antibioticus]|uniref:alcohol dehydrogenase catalytic domain-containing protein n=1 Tax=Streptomyces antibioticus TaxID=1890 RepID=UPI003F4CA5E6
MASSNRAVVFRNAKDMRVESLDFPKLRMPNGRKAPHGVVLRIVATNICGSDLHIYRGSFPVPEGMVMGHEMTGEVIEVGPDVEFLGEGDLVSVPFNVACGRCRNCRARRTDVCETTNRPWRRSVTWPSSRTSCPPRSTG